MSTPDRPANPPRERPALLILHGVNGSRAEVQGWAQTLSAAFTVHTLNLCGHGGREIPATLDLDRFCTDLVAQMDALGLSAPVVFGYSFGGLVALHLACHHPQRAAAVITLATRWIFDARGAGHSAHLVSEPRLSKLPDRVAELSQIHQPNDWAELSRKLSAMYESFARSAPLDLDDLRAISCPCLVVTGTADPIASVEETMALQRAIPGSRAASYPGSAHPPRAVPMTALQPVFVEWLGQLVPPAAAHFPLR